MEYVKGLGQHLEKVIRLASVADAQSVVYI